MDPKHGFHSDLFVPDPPVQALLVHAKRCVGYVLASAEVHEPPVRRSRTARECLHRGCRTKQRRGSSV